ncbi:MAG: ATP-binding cassette domain-containing protein [Chloroherpetonaceae bacterium]|nr:ATP-binding cassette domain-containing protein [Chloroherpetonaceae bacterium]
MTKECVIEVSHLVKEYRSVKKESGILGTLKSLLNRQYQIKKAVNDVSFKIEKGELVGFLGANGAGKTTTLKILSGLLFPSQGNVRVLGYEPSKRSDAFRRQFSIVLGQKNQLIWDLPADDSFLLLKEIYEIPTPIYHQRLDELCRMMDVKDKLGIQLRQLSLGERMKMELIGALLHAPKVLFLDEPTIGLDVVAQKSIREFIKKLSQAGETTIILTSHYMQDIEELCDRVMIMDAGKLIFDGALGGIIEKFSSEKLLSIDFERSVTEIELRSYGRVTEVQDEHAKLRLPRKDISTRSATLLSSFPVKDITIEDIPIEDIIREIFEKRE